jgi:hypothetical protein
VETLTVRNTTDWNRVGATGHAVQFYDHDGLLADQLAGYVGSALITGEGAVVIATNKHRNDVRARLALRGFDVAIARSEGRYVSVDADEVLRTIVDDDGWPSPTRFRDVIGGVLAGIRRAVGTERPRIAAFGEMVALLCSSGQFEAAIRLEELWNDLAATHTFSLLCAYPMSLFKVDANAAARFMKVCAQHSHVFSADRRNPLARPLRG